MKLKLMIVDDSVTIQKIVAMAFENENMVVQGASNGKEALEKLKDFHPDIIITDVDMPGIDGFEVSRKIRELEALKTVPILLLTSDFEEFNETLFKRSLADDHLSKPFKSEKIVEKVHQLLNSHSKSDDAQLPEESNSTVNQDTNHNSEITETNVDEDIPLPPSSENQQKEDSSEDILKSLKQETEKTVDYAEPEEKKSQPDIDSKEIDPSATAKKPEDMTIEELLASAEALLEENYDESGDEKEVSISTESSKTSEESNQISEMVEPILSEEDSNLESSEIILDKENDPNLNDIMPTSETVNPKDEINETPSFEAESPFDQKEDLVFEESLESELKELSENPIENNLPILEESNLQDDTEKPAEQMETNDLDDSFLHSPTSENDTVIDDDPLLEAQSAPTEPIHTEWLEEGTTESNVDEKADDFSNDSESAKEDQLDDQSHQTIDELDAVFENIQNFENHFKNAIQTDSDSESPPLESPSSIETPISDFLEKPTEEESISVQESEVTQETMHKPNKIETDPIFEEDFSSQKPPFAPEFSDYNISPEPDNLLEKLAPSAFDSPGTEGRPDLIQETLAYLSELTPEPSKTKPKEKTKPAPSEKKELHMDSEPIGDMFVKVVGEHVKRILERSLEETIAREISGLSKTIERSVKEVVKEVTPEITRSIIKEEIEKIRKLEEV
jgi:DNA-binding response OmpR family regulator